MLIDVSHCGERTTLEALDHWAVPVAVTHANARALRDTPRNKSDRVIRAVGRAGGVVGAVMWTPLSGGRRRPTADDLAAHVARVARVGGPGAPSIGTDLTEGVYRCTRQWERNMMTSEHLYPDITAHVGPWYRYEHRYVEGLESLATLARLPARLAGRSRHA